MTDDVRKQTEIESAELLAIYQHAYTDIENAKRTQWQLAYYAVALYAGIITLSYKLDNLPVAVNCFLEIGLIILGTMLWASSLLLISNLDNSFKKFRNRLFNIYDALQENSRKVLNYCPSQRDSREEIKEDYSRWILCLIRGAITASYFISVIILVGSLCVP